MLPQNRCPESAILSAINTLHKGLHAGYIPRTRKPPTNKMTPKPSPKYFRRLYCFYCKFVPSSASCNLGRVSIYTSLFSEP